MFVDTLSPLIYFCCNKGTLDLLLCQVLMSWFCAGITNYLNPLFLSIMEVKRQLESMHLNDDECRRRELSWL
ncbi:hypothetical protein V1521DRAFT_437937, partial [Lipomyces starkeyi]